MKTTDFAYCLTKYLGSYLPGQVGVSKNTILSYRDTFTIFLKFCRDIAGIPSEYFTLADLSRDVSDSWHGWNPNATVAYPQETSDYLLFTHFASIFNMNNRSPSQDFRILYPFRTRKMFPAISNI